MRALPDAGSGGAMAAWAPTRAATGGLRWEVGATPAEGTLTLGQLVRESEAALFVGRTRELRAVRAALEEASARPALVYVHGPAGAGKSALLNACRRLAEEAACRPLTLAAEAGSEGGALVLLLDRLERALALAPAPGEAPETRLERLAAAAAREAAERGLALLVDDYDRLGEEEPLFRERFLERLGPGTCAVLAGRRPPAELWPGRAGWFLTLRELRLEPLDEEEAALLLARLGAGGPAAARALRAVSGGHPGLLVRLAQHLAAGRSAGDGRGGVPAEAGDEEELDGFLVERWLHPRTRRTAWRAGGAALDEAVAAASLPPFFDRPSLRAAVGETAAEAAWPVLEPVALPAPGGVLRLPESLRARLRALVRRQRPWAEARWRRRLLAHALERAAFAGRQGRSETAWPLAAELAEEAAWYPALHPAAERSAGWRVLEEACPGACPLTRPPRRCLQVRDARGRPAGCLVALPSPRRPAVLEVTDAWEPEGAVGALGLLLRQLAGGFHTRVEVRVTAPALSRLRAPGGRPLLAALGFEPEPGPRGADPAWRLDLGRRGFAGWLGAILGQPAPLLPPERWAEAAREALLALREPERLAAGELGRALAERHRRAVGPAWIRSWLLDALRSPELEEGGDVVPVRRLLQLYYVERVGSHERVAEHLNVSRATYFRWHREALRRLGEALSG